MQAPDLFDEVDGLEFEKKFMSMVARFKDAHLGVSGNDVERALAAEDSGDLETLRRILNREFSAEAF